MHNAFPWITRAGYYHKGVALRLVNTQLTNRQHANSDALIGAVANLANIETLAGNFDAAETHLRGLISLVQTRGGLETFKDNFILEWAITWVDMNLAVQYGRLPLFPAIHDPNDLHLPRALIESATYPPLGDLFTPGQGVPELIEVIRLLRLTLLAQDEIEAIPDSMRILMICTDHSILELLILSTREAHVSRLTRIVNSAAHVFLHRALRQVPNNSLGFHNLLRRLRENLEDENSPEVAPSISIPLLWALIIGVAATCDLPEQFTWFSSQLTAVFSIFNQQYTISRPQLEQRLKAIIWLDQSCQLGLDTLWMSGHDK